MTAEALGFARVIPNSLDAVSDRDFLLDLSYACSVSCMHLSRLCEEIVLWSSAEFGFVELSDAFSTGSSIMPQKKNPDFAELIRGKTGRVVGDLVALLVTMKALPLAYNTVSYTHLDVYKRQTPSDSTWRLWLPTNRARALRCSPKTYFVRRR